MPPRYDEESPLLGQEHSSQEDNNDQQDVEVVKFTAGDEENPRNWSSSRKLMNVAIIALMAVLSPLASAMFTPGIQQIADDLKTSREAVVSMTTSYVIMLGIGPLILAPLSETFGRRALYLWCFAIFTLLQIPTALSSNIQMLVTLRAVAGFFGSIGIANGGGTISDMYEPHERAGIFGWYLLGPLLGPTIGPLFGGIIISRLNWRWIYWITGMLCLTNTLIGYLFLRETYIPALLQKRKARLIRDQNDDGQPSQPSRNYRIEDQDDRSLAQKLRSSLKRPLVIFLQPIVLTMSIYQALIFGTTFSIFTNLQEIFGDAPYDFDSEEIGLLYLAPGIGFLTSAWFLVPRIDTVYNKLTEKHNGKAVPEFRLPLANIGSILIPASLFWFAWTAEKQLHWAIIMLSTYFYGVGQVIVFNSVQNYYIDSFEKYAASAIAGGSVFRSLIGGAAPLLAPTLLKNLGYGWGISVFGFLAILLAPSPMIFYYFGGRLRERFSLKL